MKMFGTIFVMFLAASPAVTSVVKPQNSIEICRIDEFSCSDGACVSLDRFCDGRQDCSDGSDEQCLSPISSYGVLTLLNRTTRQVSCNGHLTHRCRDGSCISFDQKCDGRPDCPDGSDETMATCINNKCLPQWFRCAYGACADGDAKCNGRRDCADNSDELHPDCSGGNREERGRFQCADGSTISSTDKCDGVPNCADGSDESVRACGHNTCPGNLQPCAYGACVDAGSHCNGKVECADGSDEAEDLCEKKTSTGTTGVGGPCKLPPYPDHGSYKVLAKPGAKPGQSYQSFTLTASCRAGYKLNGQASATCDSGIWVQELPSCIRTCRLNLNDVAVKYKCKAGGNVRGTRPCSEFEPSGTLVEPTCNTNYYAPFTNLDMECIDGQWNGKPTCLPDCGRETAQADTLSIGGTPIQLKEFPWHVGVYQKYNSTHERPLAQICGGTVLRRNIVVTAAHCFSESISRPDARRYSIAAGKTYRPFYKQHNVAHDTAQRSDIAKVYIPEAYTGAATHFESDIAVAILVIPFVYNNYVQPICLDFEPQFDKTQLTSGNMGKVVGWGITERDQASDQLREIRLPYIDRTTCQEERYTPQDHLAFLTSDKLCAGYIDGTAAACRGDSGGGLVFPSLDRQIERHYLRGIVSVAQKNRDPSRSCNAEAITKFTKVTAPQHEYFLKDIINREDVDKD